MMRAAVIGCGFVGSVSRQHCLRCAKTFLDLVCDHRPLGDRKGGYRQPCLRHLREQNAEGRHQVVGPSGFGEDAASLDLQPVEEEPAAG